MWASHVPLGNPQSSASQGQAQGGDGAVPGPSVGPSSVRDGSGSPFVQQLLNGEVGPEPLNVVPENVVLLLQGLLHLLQVHLLREGQVSERLGQGWEKVRGIRNGGLKPGGPVPGWPLLDHQPIDTGSIIA